MGEAVDTAAAKVDAAVDSTSKNGWISWKGAEKWMLLAKKWKKLLKIIFKRIDYQLAVYSFFYQLSLAFTAVSVKSENTTFLIYKKLGTLEAGHYYNRWASVAVPKSIKYALEAYFMHFSKFIGDKAVLSASSTFPSLLISSGYDNLRQFLCME
jgi:hypothetical protein